ncbi:MAG: LVIVD repeat-containing protein [Candidatus Thorarchaeota archaeon]
MKGRYTRVICYLVLITILNSILSCFVLRASANQIVLTKVGQVETGDAYDVWVDSNKDITYVSCGYSGVKVFDTSDPYEPTELASVPSSSGGYAHQLFMRDDTMFVGDGNGGLKIINFEDESNPVVLSQFTGNYAWDVAVVEDVAFVANGFSGIGCVLTSVNVTNLTAPELLGSISTAGDATDVEVMENLAFATTSYAGFTVFDITNRTNPTQVAQYVGESTSDAELGDLEIVGDLAFLSYWEKSFKVLNISDISNIRVVSEFDESLHAFSVHIDMVRNLAFLCDVELGLLLLDIQNPSQPTEVARYSDGGKPNRIELVGNYIYMTDEENGFVILEIKQSDEPIIGLEPIILIGGLAAIVLLYVWMRKIRTSGDGAESVGTEFDIVE